MHRGSQGVWEMGARLVLWDRCLGHGGISGLKGGYHETIAPEAPGRLPLGLMEEGGPPSTGRWSEQVEAVPGTVEASLPDRPVDGDAPQHAGFSGERIGMGEIRNRPGRPGDGVVIAEVGKGHRRRSHETPVAGAAARMAGEVLGCALWCFLRSPEDAEEVIVTAVSGGRRDADTVAAMAGTLVGAYLGEEALPSRWREDLEDAERIAGVAVTLHDIAEDRPRQAETA